MLLPAQRRYYSAPGHFFGTSAQFWFNLKKLYELRLAEKKAASAIKALPTLKNESPVPGNLAAEHLEH